MRCVPFRRELKDAWVGIRGNESELTVLELGPLVAGCT